MYEHLRIASPEQLIMFTENAEFMLNQAEMTLLAIKNEVLRRQQPELFEEVQIEQGEQIDSVPNCGTTTTHTTTISGGSAPKDCSHTGWDSEGCYHDPSLRIERTDIAQLNL